MKHFIIPTSILLFVIALIISNQYILKSLTQTLEDEMIQIEEYIINEDYANSTIAMEKFSANYKKYNGYFSVVIRHTELDEIRLLVKRLEAYNKSQDKTMFLAESNALKDMLSHIYFLDTITIENVF